ncbi:MAG: hypothetical protein JST00_29835 [Deltaproteobacteria bacterium]|nr:hypothetical protein [Deltaproteobacteria bacterium]
MLGVSDQFHGAAPAKCGLKKVGREPEAVLCATPPPKNTSQTEDSNNRKCEYCVAVEPEVKCDEELKVKAKVETAFELPLPYKLGTLSCDAGAEYEAEAKAKIEVQNTKWNSFADGSGTDEAVKYISSITKSSALSAAKINLAGSCKLDGRLIDAAMSAKINLECEIKSTATLGATADRDKKTCGDDPCATKAEPQTSDVMAKAIAHPCPDTETTTANEPEDAGTPETSTVLVTDQVHAF